jgi:phosphoglycolate phosphatase
VNLIVFDVDGTLVDSQNLIVAAQRETFVRHGLEPPSRTHSLSIVGLSLTEAFTVLAGPHAPIESLAEGYRQAFARLRTDPAYHEPLFPGAGELLAELASRPDVTLGIATGKSQRGVSHLLARHGWDRIFATIQTADDAPSKPHPAMLLQAMAEVGARPERSVMIGDSTFDMTMARASGMGAVGVSWGYHGVEALRGAGARVIVDTCAELRSHLLDAVIGAASHSPM